MARFAVGESITTREPAIEVDAGLAIGSHRFSLVVVDANGRRSVPDVVTVRVQRLDVPPIDRPPDPSPVPFGGVPPGGAVQPGGPVRPRGRAAAPAGNPPIPATSKRKRSDVP